MINLKEELITQYRSNSILSITTYILACTSNIFAIYVASLYMVGSVEGVITGISSTSEFDRLLILSISCPGLLLSGLALYWYIRNLIRFFRFEKRSLSTIEWIFCFGFIGCFAWILSWQRVSDGLGVGIGTMIIILISPLLLWLLNRASFTKNFR